MRSLAYNYTTISHHLLVFQDTCISGILNVLQVSLSINIYKCHVIVAMVTVLIDRLEELGDGICEHNGLPDIRETASFSDLSLVRYNEFINEFM